MDRNRIKTHLLVWLASLGIFARATLCPAQPPATAEEILRTTGLKGGIIVHLGCGDGRLTAALRAGESFTVHGLDRDPARAQAAREHIGRLGLYGPVSVGLLQGPALPYADNLINLLVASDTCGVADAEMLRVLAPGGAALVTRHASFVTLRKPRPAAIGEWSHFLHDAGNNAVARDTVVGPPRALQWVAPPLWLRSHETPSGVQAMVSAGGRLFYVFDEGLIGITDQRLPERWSLICRDAFNGRLLWRRPLDKWGWPEWASDKFGGADWTTITGGRTVVPEVNQRRLVADGSRLYATLSYRAPLSILDAATGETLATVKEATPANEIVSADGIAVVHVTDPNPPAARRKAQGKGKAAQQGAPSTLVAVEGRTGRVLWRRQAETIRPLSLAIDQGRVVFQAGSTLKAVRLKDGEELWAGAPAEKQIRTLVAHDGVVMVLGQAALEARDGASGKSLWRRDVTREKGMGGEDLFVVDGVVWPSMLSVDDNNQTAPKAANALAVGYDLRTGEERKRITVRNLRSPEHHHRCYRNKATSRFMISAMEGAEFLDLRGDGHSQNNWLRGACKLGVMPCNGLLYVPSDQCFCEPGAKLLGFTAVAAEPETPRAVVPDAQRLVKGTAYAERSKLEAQSSNAEDWPTFRHDAARHGSSPTAVGARVAARWRVKLGTSLTAPVAAGGRVYVADRDAHTLHALDAQTGKGAWRFVAEGRIDSPPTVHKGIVLFGSADGHVYCLRASDGALAWRFLAAPSDRRIGSFDQLESVWPVHGSVLVRDDVAYFTAGRSTYLDGGIRVYALDPFTGRVLHTATLQGPVPDLQKERDVSFYVLGANSDVLVSEGDAIYLRQKRLSPSLEEAKPNVLSNKGEADVGLHVFSTSGLLDGSWYNRAFWMYSKRWPGFQLANQAPKSGQLLVVDGQQTYGVNVFYRRNVHSPMFFPGKEGYLLFADKNTTEPQIVGEAGSRKPVAWLPQSDYQRREGTQRLDMPAFGLDKMIGYTRADPPVWTLWLPVRVRAMVKAGDMLFAAGPPDVLDEAEPTAAFEGRRGARLVAVSASDGKKTAEIELDAPPVFDGLIAANGRLFVSLEDGSLACLGK